MAGSTLIERANLAKTALDLAGEVLDKLDRIVDIGDAYERQREREQIRYLRFGTTTSGPGVTFELNPPPGSYWIIERIVTVGAANHNYQLYLDGNNLADMIDFAVAGAGITVMAREVELHLPDSSKGTFILGNLGAGGAAVGVNIRVKELALGE